MGLDFLRSNGAHRIRDYMAQPMLLTEGQALSENDEENPPDLDYEVSSDKWKPHNPARGTFKENGQNDQFALLMVKM